MHRAEPAKQASIRGALGVGRIVVPRRAACTMILCAHMVPHAIGHPYTHSDSRYECKTDRK